MIKLIWIEVEDDQHKRLREIKDWRGYTSKGLLLDGAKALDTDETKQWDRQLTVASSGSFTAGFLLAER